MVYSFGFCEGSSQVPPLRQMQSSITPPQDPCKGFRLNNTPTDIPRMAMPITKIARNNCICKITKKRI